MEKKDLKNGMFVELRNGKKGVVVSGKIVYQNGKWGDLRTYKDNLSAKCNDKGYDIITIYGDDTHCFNCCSQMWAIWERPEEKQEILNKEEKEYLSAVIKPFRKTSNISMLKTRTMDNTKHCIIIYLVEPKKYQHFIKFPPFEKDKMYKGMELDTEYTLEELGL